MVQTSIRIGVVIQETTCYIGTEANFLVQPFNYMISSDKGSVLDGKIAGRYHLLNTVLYLLKVFSASWSTVLDFLGWLSYSPECWIALNILNISFKQERDMAEHIG